jgi:hypothetical protein
MFIRVAAVVVVLLDVVQRSAAAVTVNCVNQSYPSSDCCTGHIAISSTVSTIAAEAFAACTNLLSVEVGTTVVSMGDQVFAITRNLLNVTLPTSLTEWGSRVFAKSGLTSITLPTSLAYLPSEAFWGCSTNISITLTTALTRIEAGAFGGIGMDQTDIQGPCQVHWFGDPPAGTLYVPVALAPSVYSQQQLSCTVVIFEETDSLS